MEVVERSVCQAALRNTRLGPTYSLHPGMICAGGQSGKDACKVRKDIDFKSISMFSC